MGGIFVFKAIKNKLIGVCLVAFALLLSFAGGVFAKQVQASAEEGTKTIVEIEKTELIQNTVIFYLDKADYMTADEWDTTNYKWTDSITSANKHEYNVHNAVFEKNLEKYNYGTEITIDGMPLQSFDTVVCANRFTRVNGFGITFNSYSIMDGTEIRFAAGCTLPTLSHAYLGEAEFTYLEIAEEIIFKVHGGTLVRSYAFDGYQEGVSYDADEKMFYTRAENSSYFGHEEAPTYAFTDFFSTVDWGDEGFAIQSTPNTKKGNLFVLEFINPINANEFAKIDVRFFSNIAREVVAFNAYNVTATSLGEPLERFSIARVYSTQSLLTRLYADENGMVDRLVFRFENDYSELPQDNPLFVTSFGVSSCEVVYDNSFAISETDTESVLSVRFNKSGEAENAVLDTERVLVNGVTVASLLKTNACKQAIWANFGALYEIRIVMDKAYTGAGAIKNRDLSYTGNSVAMLAGLQFPDGEALEANFTCRIYHGENYVDSPNADNYSAINVSTVTVQLAADAANNIRFMLFFNYAICPQGYYHACETESWRETSLEAIGYYDEAVSKAFVYGGYKSSLYDNIYINGRSIGEWHAIDACPTSVHVHYGQSDGGNANLMTVAIDSTSEMYAELIELYESGEGVTIEVKSGMIFPTGYQTTGDQTYVLRGTQMQEVFAGETLRVYYDGKAVQSGDLVLSSTAINAANIAVEGVLDYTLTEEVSGGVAQYTVTANGETITFMVQSVIVNEKETNEGGCGSSVGALSALGLMLCIGGIFLKKGGRRDE